MPLQVTTTEGRAAAQTATDAQNAGNALATLTIPQAEAWIDANVTAATLAVLKASLKTIARLLILLRDRQTKIIAEQHQLEKRIKALEG